MSAFVTRRHAAFSGVVWREVHGEGDLELGEQRSDHVPVAVRVRECLHTDRREEDRRSHARPHDDGGEIELGRLAADSGMSARTAARVDVAAFVKSRARRARAAELRTAA